MESIKIKNRLYNLNEPCIMGILNYTKDSFYDGGQYFNEQAILNRIQQMCNEGADIIDIGCMSTKPDSEAISEYEELSRVQYILNLIHLHFPNIILSIDSYRASVAEYALTHGVSIINDISGGAFDNDLWNVVAKYQAPYVLSHTSGLPVEMQHHTNYKDIIEEMIYYFSIKINLLHQKGIHDIILDPGFGFAKTLDQNYILFNHLSDFHIFNLPIMIGISRKSMIYKLLETTPEYALNGTTTLHAMAMAHKITFFRVHDISAMANIKNIAKKLLEIK